MQIAPHPSPSLSLSLSLYPQRRRRALNPFNSVSHTFVSAPWPAHSFNTITEPPLSLSLQLILFNVFFTRSLGLSFGDACLLRFHSLLVLEGEGEIMENGAERESGAAAMMFNEEDVREISGFKRGDDYVEVTCGCTSHRYGDAVGRLRVFVSGDLEISCECTPGCQEAKLTPAAFEKHSGRETARKWKNNVWVIVDGEKVPLFKTLLLKYYDQAPKGANRLHRSQNGRVGHRDEFVRCTRCNKDRRFRLRTKEECRIYHDALADVNWKCADTPYDKINCDDDEERASRRVYRGCSRSPTCRGCTSCVCFGCEICRFSDCSCQTCIDFTRNVKV